MNPSPSQGALERSLSPRERSAVRSFVWRVLDEIPAHLVEAALFGSRARGCGRLDSDVDVLLVFDRLPPDREPQAGHAERIAVEVARDTGVPVTVWSVSLDDTFLGNRTPMLVDALADAIPIWCWPEPLSPVSFTADDAIRCCDALLARVREGGVEFLIYLQGNDVHSAARRARDDLVRLCTALLLLRGVTRPRRGEALRRVSDGAIEEPLPTYVHAALEWGCHSFGPDGRDDDGPVVPPSGGLETAARAIDFLLGAVTRGATDLYKSVKEGSAPHPLQ